MPKHQPGNGLPEDNKARPFSNSLRWEQLVPWPTAPRGRVSRQRPCKGCRHACQAYDSACARLPLLPRCGDPLAAMSEELSFRTPQAPGPAAFPQRLGLIGDLGQTYNSSSTLRHVLQSDPPVRAQALSRRLVADACPPCAACPHRDHASHCCICHAPSCCCASLPRGCYVRCVSTTKHT